MFSEELERARDEQEGSGLEAERRTELAGERRATRRASFGAQAPEAPPAPTQEHDSPRAEDFVPGPVARPEPTSARALEAAPAAPATSDGSAASSAPSGGNDAATHVAPPSTLTIQPSSTPLAVALAAGAPERAPLAALPVPPPPALEPAPLAGASTRAPLARAAGGGASPAPAGQAMLARAEEILRQVELHLGGGVKRLSFELEPLDLGRLSIQLALRGGKVAAIVRGERPETLELLRTREEDLKRLLAERGIEAESVRFELGFKHPSEARHARPSTSSGPGHAPRASGGPVSFDSYA